MSRKEILKGITMTAGLILAGFSGAELNTCLQAAAMPIQQCGLAGLLAFAGVSLVLIGFYS